MPQPLPTAPDSLPAYVADGLARQDPETLQDAIAFAEQLIDHHERELEPEEIEDGTDDDIEDIEQTSEGTKVIKTVTCGKDNCKCADGEGHGPYEYRARRDGGSLTWEYIGKA